MKKVLVGMSGGVDSATAALLLQRAGYEVEGVMLHLWSDAGFSDAKAVCDALGIPLTLLDEKERFLREVVEPFAAEYTAGRTPNPCVRCNRYIKIGHLARLAKERGAGHIATGHYARTEVVEGRKVIRRAAYLPKDQSYALCMIPRDALEMLLLPLGEFSKEEVRALAAEASLPVAHKAESQDICFVPDGDYASFLERHAPGKNPPGSFVLEDGTGLGAHRGLWHYTVGQRKGLGISLGKPVFVRRIDAGTGDVILSEDEALYTNRLRTGSVHWLDRETLETPERFSVKLRYSAKSAQALVEPEENGAVITFIEPQRAITPGQSAALYKGDILCGGGVILD